MKLSRWLQLAAVGERRAPVSGTLTASGRIFRCDGEPWRWKGVSAFPLCAKFARGENIDAFLDAFDGFNLLRAWDYVTWPGTGWASVQPDGWLAFLGYVGARGWRVELTLLTDDDPKRIAQATFLVNELAKAKPTNVVIEIGNEPNIHKNIDVIALRQTCEASGFLFASGLNDVPGDQWFGSYLTAHTPRDQDWPRKGHDLKEYFEGGGPGAPTDPPHAVPCVGDEPLQPTRPEPDKPDAIRYAGGDWEACVRDYRAYFGVCALLGAGATFHFEGGKYGIPPTPQEARCAAAALEGLNAFPAAAPLGPYNRPEDSSLRTYVVGDGMVRVRPTSREGVVPGTPLDPDGILWRL